MRHKLNTAYQKNSVFTSQMAVMICAICYKCNYEYFIIKDNKAISTACSLDLYVFLVPDKAEIHACSIMSCT